MRRQKVPDDEDIDINQIAQGDSQKMIEIMLISLQSSTKRTRPKD